MKWLHFGNLWAMKRLLGFLLFGLFLTGTGQSQDSTQEWIPPFKMLIPAGWRVERFKFPLDFAPEIPLKGFEEARFAPGWADLQDKWYWSYAFLWSLEGQPLLSDSLLKKYLTNYYTGLICRNIIDRKIPEGKMVPLLVNLRKTVPDPGDLETLTGSIRMLDYMAGQPITLNCSIHKKASNSVNRSFIFFEISPTPFDKDIWLLLGKIKESFGYAPKIPQ